MNYAENWNRLDSFIFFCENKLEKAKAALIATKEDEPDVELMIQAETEHLRAENETLKKRELPIRIIEKDGIFLCPKCMAVLPDPNVKYCGSCGHRVMNVEKFIEGK